MLENSCMTLSVANLQMLEQTARPADGASESEPGHIKAQHLLPARRNSYEQRLAHKIQHLTKRVLNEVHYAAYCSAVHALGSAVTRH